MSDLYQKLYKPMHAAVRLGTNDNFGNYGERCALFGYQLAEARIATLEAELLAARDLLAAKGLSTEKRGYLIGQRVIIKGEGIGYVERPDPKHPAHFGIWVFSHSRGHSCNFALSSIEPLPNGQL
jgi:hypothetical protein